MKTASGLQRTLSPTQAALRSVTSMRKTRSLAGGLALIVFTIGVLGVLSLREVPGLPESIEAVSSPAVPAAQRLVQVVRAKVPSRVLGRSQIVLGLRIASPEDPYRQPGYVWWSKKVKETRFIPYDVDNLYENVELDSTSGPPSSALARAAPPYLRWVGEPDAEKRTELAFMRDKHVVLSCDSHCSGIVAGFCAFQAPGAATFEFSLHNHTICKIPALNFTMSTWFHFGIVKEEEAEMAPQIGKQEPPYQFEKRLDELHSRRAEIDGTPGLFVFDSNYWDTVLLGYRAGKYDHNPVLPYDREGYSYSELAYHRKRVSEMVQHLRKRYPQTQIMWKPAHLRSMNAHTGKAGEGMTGSSDVEQINQSTRILMHKLGVPVLEWAPKIHGYTDYLDAIHWKAESGANFLAADMLLHYLHESLQPAMA